MHVGRHRFLDVNAQRVLLYELPRHPLVALMVSQVPPGAGCRPRVDHTTYHFTHAGWQHFHERLTEAVDFGAGGWQARRLHYPSIHAWVLPSGVLGIAQEHRPGQGDFLAPGHTLSPDAAHWLVDPDGWHRARARLLSPSARPGLGALLHRPRNG